MQHNKIKDAFLSAVNSVIANPEQFAVNSAKDFSRQRKITPDTLISFLVSKGLAHIRLLSVSPGSRSAMIPTNAS